METLVVNRSIIHTQTSRFKFSILVFDAWLNVIKFLPFKQRVCLSWGQLKPLFKFHTLFNSRHITLYLKLTNCNAVKIKLVPIISWNSRKIQFEGIGSKRKKSRLISLWIMSYKQYLFLFLQSLHFLIFIFFLPFKTNK